MAREGIVPHSSREVRFEMVSSLFDQHYSSLRRLPRSC